MRNQYGLMGFQRHFPLANFLIMVGWRVIEVDSIFA